MTSFLEIWDYLQFNLELGTPIRNWTAFGGYLGDEMTFVGVSADRIRVNAPDAKNVEVVPRDDFEKVRKF